MARVRKWVEWAGVVLVVANVAVIFWLHYGMADSFLGLGPVEEIAERFDHSYSTTDNPHQVWPGDPAFRPMLRLMDWYSRTPPDAKRVVYIVRLKAFASAKGPMMPNGQVAEWTAPTPIIVSYLPEGKPGTAQDFVDVGTAVDLHAWIQRARDDFHFIVVDVLFGVLSALIAVLLVVIRAEAIWG